MRFVDEIGADTQLNTKDYQVQAISVVQLDDTRVFVAYYEARYHGELHGIVITIEGEAITVGQSTYLASQSEKGLSAVRLDENRVFIAHGTEHNDSYYGYLSGIVVSVSGTTITRGTNTILSLSMYSGQYICAVRMDENKVLIAYRYDFDPIVVHGIIVTISDKTITKEMDGVIGGSCSSYVSAVRLDESRVFISYSNSNGVYGSVVTVDGTTILPGTDTVIGAIPGGYRTNVLALDKNRVFYAYGRNNCLDAVILTIEGTTITVGQSVNLCPDEPSGSNFCAAMIDDKKVCVVHAGSNYLNCVIAYIDAETIAGGVNVTLSTQLIPASGSGHIFPISVAPQTKNKFFVAHSGFDIDKSLFGLVYERKAQVAVPENVFGLAKTKGADGETIEVYIPTIT